jgi:flagellar protein FlaG
MESGIKSTISPMAPSDMVSLSDAFKKGAQGPVQRQDVSFDGKLSPADPAAKVAQVIDPAVIDAAVARIADYVESLSRSLAITVDDRSGDFVVQVQDANTEEIIRQIPSEEVLAISAAIAQQVESLRLMGEEGAQGLLLDLSA